MDVERLERLATRIGWLAFGPGTERGEAELQSMTEAAVRAALGNRHSMELTFEIECDGDVHAGLMPYRNRLVVTTDEHPGGESEEFEEWLTAVIAEWFDGAKVTCTWVTE